MMLGIFIMIGAYRYYAGLAEKFGKTRWIFGILALSIYLGSQLIFGFGYGIYKGIVDPGSLENLNYTGFSTVNFIGWIVSILMVYGIYKLLEKKSEKESITKPALEIEEIGNRKAT